MGGNVKSHLPLLIVDVYAIWTRNARSSTTAEGRLNRFRTDVNNANRVWRTGFGSEHCNIFFNRVSIFNFTARPPINVSAIPSSPFPNVIENLINEVRARQGIRRRAIFLVYVSGQSFSNGAIGVGGFRFINDDAWGRVALPDGARTYTFAHEAGHVLGLGHNTLTRNIMNSPSPSVSPLVTANQCTIARRSRVIRR